MKSECIRIYCPESQCGDQPLQSHRSWEEHFTWKLKKIEYVSFSEEMKSECIRIYIVRNVLKVASTPSMLHFWGFFFESKEHLAWKFKKIEYISFSGEMKSECIQLYIVRKVKSVEQLLQSHGFWEEHFTWKLKKIAYILLSKEMKSECIRIYIVGTSSTWLQPLQCCDFFESKERLARKIAYVLFSGEMKSECIRIYYPESQCGDQPLQSRRFWEEHFTWKLKKIEYVSFSEEMKSECIRIYIVRNILNVNSTPSVLRFFWEQGTPSSEDCVRFVCRGN